MENELTEEQNKWFEAWLREKKRKLRSKHKHKIQKFYHKNCGGRLFFKFDADDVSIYVKCRKCKEYYSVGFSEIAKFKFYEEE